MSDSNGGDRTRKWAGAIGDTQELLLIPTDTGGSSAKELDFRIFWPLVPGLTANYRGGANYTWTVQSVALVLVQ